MSDEERELIERMRNDAARNGDHRGAADLDALLLAAPVSVPDPKEETR